MQSDKLILAIERLTSEERLKFKDYLRSPYFNKSEKLIDLYDRILSGLSGGRTLSENPSSRKNNLAVEKSRLFKHLRHFVSYRQFEESPIDFQLSMLQGLHFHGMHEQFIKQVTKFQQADFNELERKGFNYLQNQANVSYFWLKTRDLVYRQQEESQALESLSELVEANHLFKLMEVLITWKTANYSVSDVGLETKFDERIQYIKERLSTDRFKNLYPINLMKLAFEVVVDASDPSELMEMLSELHEEQSADLNNFYYRIAINRLVLRQNQEGASEAEKIAELFEHCFEHDYLVFEIDHNGPLISQQNISTYTNCLLTLRRVSDAKAFLNRLDNLDEDYAVTVNRCMARCYAKEGEYRKALETISAQSPDTMSEYIKTKTSQIQWSYELNESNLVQSYIGALRTYCSTSKKIPQALKDNVLQFCVCVSQLLKLHEPELAKADHQKRDAYIRKLTSNIQSFTIQSSSVRWLESKIGSL